MNNAATKGGAPQVIDRSCKSPGLETLWQLHYSEKGGAEHNTAAEYIANPQGADPGNYFVLTASPKGSFTVYNSGNKQARIMRPSRLFRAACSAQMEHVARSLSVPFVR